MQDDLKAAFRSLRSSKDVTLAALIVLTLGIGATTAASVSLWALGGATCSASSFEKCWSSRSPAP